LCLGFMRAMCIWCSAGARRATDTVSCDNRRCAPGENHGADVDAARDGTVNEQRLYQLVRQSGTITDRTFEIRFLNPGVQAFAFTLG